MKKLFALCLVAVMAAFTACTPSTTTTTTGTDSTATTLVDSTKTPPVDSGAPVVTGDPVDSAGTAPATDSTGRMANPNRDISPIVTTYRLTVSFISIGGGIDHAAKTKYDKFVTEFEARNNVKLAKEVVGWGREGEVDYCFKLAELKELKQAAFVKESKALLNGNEMVVFKENANCRVKRK